VRVYGEIRRLETSVFSFSHFDRFQHNLVHGQANDWHCRAGSRFLYICEDGLVHYCSQQRGHPGLPLETYGQADLDREYETVKGCAPHCSISCVHQTAMLDEVRANPRGMLHQLVAQRKALDPAFETPMLLRFLSRVFLENPQAAALGRSAAKLLGLSKSG